MLVASGVSSSKLLSPDAFAKTLLTDLMTVKKGRCVHNNNYLYEITLFPL